MFWRKPKILQSRDRPTVGGLGVLFVSHDATRTGAPRVLLHLLRWLTRNTSIRFSVLLRSDSGDLKTDFHALSPVVAWTGVAKAVVAASPQPLGLIYSNTITNGVVLEALAPLGLPVISHVHELEYRIRHQLDPADLARTLAHTSHYIAASHGVRDVLVEQLGVHRDCVTVIPDFIAVDNRVSDSARSTTRALLGIPEDGIVVGGCGTTDWRKGPDLFVQLAASVARRRPDLPVHFVWVGGSNQGPEYAALWYDVQRCGMEERVRFVGAQATPRDYFEAFDLFALTSREDPFPLVALEAAELGKPIVCFGGAGNAPDLVGETAGVVVPYLDVEAAAAAITTLAEAPEKRRALGQAGAARVRALYDVETAGPEILSVIHTVAGKSPARR